MTYYGFEFNEKYLKNLDENLFGGVGNKIEAVFEYRFFCGVTLNMAAKNSSISIATLSRFIHGDLKKISPDLYKDVIKKIDWMKHRGRTLAADIDFIKMTEEGWI